jgi:transcriptional regulator with GAF, ATPase, and Fis domain
MTPAARHAMPPESSGGVSGGREASEYRQALANTRYNVAEAARSLGLTRPQLAYRLKKAGIV